MSRSTSHFEKVRPSAVAGRFYPLQPEELRSLVVEFLRMVKLDIAVAPKAVIAPHAGYLFSGPVAASALARFAAVRDVIRRVVLIGPSHQVPVAGVAASSADAFETPLGMVPVDTEAVARLCSLPQVAVADEAHAYEHSLEVHLPFLQIVLDQFEIVPLLVGDVSEADMAEVIAALWGGPETRFVISSDLSHYHCYAEAQKLDLETSRAIEQFRPESITEPHACGRIPICGLLSAAQQHGLHARTVDLRNSGDTAGPRDEVVGYGAFVIEAGTIGAPSTASAR